MTERTYEFNCNIIGDLKEGRPNLGDEVNIVLYRVMYYTFYAAAVKRFGREEGNKLFCEAGNIAGQVFFDNLLKTHKDLPSNDFLEKMHTVIHENGLRFLRIDSLDTKAGTCAISVATGMKEKDFDTLKLDCCDYETGFAEGLLSQYAGKEIKATTVNTSNVQDILPQWGDMINLIPYRTLQGTIRDVIEQKIGTAPCNQLFYDAGEIAGHYFFDGFMTKFKELPLNGFFGELQRILKELGVGVLRIERVDPEKGEFVLTVSEDLDCSGLPDIGLEVCNYDEGLIAGLFYKYMDVPFKAKEVDCWCSGDKTCRFIVNRT